MRRLYQKIYLVFLASLLTVVVIIGLFWRLGQPESPYSHAFEIAGELAMAALPPADAPRRLQQQALEHLSQRLHADLGRRGSVSALAWDSKGRWLSNGSDNLLGKNVEGIAKVARRFDQALVHGARDGGTGDEIGTVLGEDDPVAGGSNMMPGAADALHTAGDRGRRFNLNDEVDRAHVDAELKR